ncbi:vacuolar phytochelatin and glutathione S-conjugate ABC family transmembrane transporter Hmt1 [Schizosaccharomyces osmophilus]|uniref:Vacuolar phytochelatin and glutathione S-conjugate ABC family transmembrane transporter Hmt1 n=1 Tax=Schizosaccharomyces osmophilus TaxID=2545709 RepID=A0AAF0AWH4_9SCHI|nr:vacuolar phytochelatin and glutathione S-conjugate ABC family transmembrane transporter Hmt1 [Schizosaccharomyces osmophilus]WBW74716.1 vacuolar phytochelatin and glutathione S-conjugate ABC family transmembrane transporter Hmt1 [Schizosaccharomyces osmophilus]
MVLRYDNPHFNIAEVACLYAGFLGLGTLKTFKQQRRGPEPLSRKSRFGKEPLKIVSWWILALALTYVIDIANLVVYALRTPNWWPHKASVVCLVLSLLFWGIVLISCTDTSELPRYTNSFFSAYRVNVLYAWLTEAIFETVFLAFTPIPGDTFQGILMADHLARLLLCIFAFAIYVTYRRKKPSRDMMDYEERRMFESGTQLDPELGQDQSSQALPQAAKKSDSKKPPKNTSWIAYFKSFAILFPYLWPVKNFRLQLHIFVCVILLVIGRIANILAPRQLGVVTEKLSQTGSGVPWFEVFLFVFYRFLQGNMGLVGSLRSFLWIPVSQYAYRALSTKALQHVLGLSYDFHLNKRGGEVLAALTKANSVNTFVEQLLFQIGPVLTDLAVAIIYFFVKFDVYFSLIVLVMTFCYCYVTVKITSWRTEARRKMVNSWRDSYGVQNDAIMNYETVKNFDADDFENHRFGDAVDAYLRQENTVLSSLSVLNIIQGGIFTSSLCVACLLSAYKVSFGYNTVGDFVVLLTYMTQLQQPLNFFGTLYRSLQNSIIDAERLLEIFEEQPTVLEREDATPLKVTDGRVAFSNVSFAYDPRKPVLSNVSFVAEPGKVIALVGESGGGKSTIMRILLRFFDVNNGSITIDDQDIRDVTLSSLRSSIGVVPQDSILFNDTVMYNIKYAKPGASDEEVYEAAKAAQIHDRILEFPDGYNSRVGERGLKLSGGEKQRMAVARAILKNPTIILLDEATSALDTNTERHIQASLNRLAAGRTAIVIAHRLSTITNADLILCIHNGKIVETGTHEDLLKHEDGVYKKMWLQQANKDSSSKKFSTE